MQKLVGSPSYPKALPEPTRRNGSLTYEIRVRVPPPAQGGKFRGTHTSRSLKTRDLAEAYRRLPTLYSDLQAEFDAECARLTASDSVADAPRSPAVGEGESLSAPEPKLRDISIKEACDRYRDYIIKGERQARLEDVSAARRNIGRSVDGRGWDTPRGWNPVELAEKFRTRLDRALEHARAEAIILDYSHSDWFLKLIERESAGRATDRSRCLREMSRTKFQTLRQLIDDDEALMPKTDTLSSGPANGASVPCLPSAPRLSEFTNQYIAKRGNSLSAERAETIRATVRDLISVAEDKPVDAYTSSDAEAYEDILRTLPGNWSKKPGMRDLSLKDAAAKAAALGLAPQAPKTIRKKWTILFSVFKNAAIKHSLQNPFVAEALVIGNGGPANSQRDVFNNDELETLLASQLPGHLYWLTHLGLHTGARLNELCQLTTTHIRRHGDIPFIYFSPELRLKTGEGESCVRSVPLHDELVRKGFLDYVAKCVGPLFPGIPQHRTGRYSDAPSKAFSRHLTTIGIKRPKLSFHSLRHNFSAALKRYAPRDVETRERLLGHADSSVAGRYGNDYETEAHDMVLLAERAKVLRSIKFRSADE